MTIADIILRMTTNDERFNHLVWVGKNYSKADLIRDLRELLCVGEK